MTARMVVRVALVLGALGVAAAAPVVAQQLGERPVIDPSVHTVLSGCRWQANEREGTVRVVVRTGGYEHLISDLWVQWLAGPTDSGQPATLVAEAQPTALNDYSSVFTDVALTHQGLNSCRIALTATDTHWDPMRSAPRVLLVGAPGELRLDPVPRGE